MDCDLVGMHQQYHRIGRSVVAGLSTVGVFVARHYCVFGHGPHSYFHPFQVAVGQW